MAVGAQKSPPQDILRRLITIEGNIGVGKSTLMAFLKSFACKAIMAAPSGTKLFIAERSVASNMQVFAKASLREVPQLRTFEYAYAHIVASLRELHDLHSAWMQQSEAGPAAPKWHVVDAARDSQSVVVEALGIIMGIVAALEVDAM